MSDLREIILLIQIHHLKYPDHGLGCSCMDTFIRQVRQMTWCHSDASDPALQLRVDYVIRKALDR
jgi:hypothetical protein